MPHRVITDSPPAGPLLLGHFDRRGSYSGWRPEGTRDWLLIYTVAGSGTVTTAAGVRMVEAGHALLYLPDTPHDYRIGPSGRWELRWAHFVPPKDWLELLHWPQLAPGVLGLVVQETARRRAVETALERALQLSRRHLWRRETFALNALHEALLWCDVENPGAGKPRLDERVRRALDYITRDPRRLLTLDAVAKAAGLSVSRLSELFKSQIGVSPRQYWERHRIEHARQLLERTDLTVAEVADATGFTDPFYFSTRFSALVGRSPRAHRQHMR
ncbi:MAG: helix-turn-helix domain-containing protein [Opitutaceae bacterium]|nr:helix-turn-helix domain-containing protein [Opitutaceae bacterium]